MTTLTVTTKGKVTLRREVLEPLGVKPGEKIIVNKLPHGRIELQAEKPAGRISDAFGFLRRPRGPVLTLDEIDEAIARGWAGKT